MLLQFCLPPFELVAEDLGERRKRGLNGCFGNGRVFSVGRGWVRERYVCEGGTTNLNTYLCVGGGGGGGVSVCMDVYVQSRTHVPVCSISLIREAGSCKKYS